jgi:hypothetical protein
MERREELGTLCGSVVYHPEPAGNHELLDER